MDSVAAATVVKMLRKLAVETNIAVIMTIHQPSQKVFASFDRIYMLCNQTGRCIYEGHPNDTIEHFRKFAFTCPDIYNPADFATEVAAGNFGTDGLDQMAIFQEADIKGDLDVDDCGQEKIGLNELLLPRNQPFYAHLKILLHRNFLITNRDVMFWAQIVSHVFLCCLIWAVFGNVGKAGCCPPKAEQSFNPRSFDQTRDYIMDEIHVASSNSGLLFLASLMLALLSMFYIIFNYPEEVQLTKKEKQNNWYSTFCYFCAKSLLDMPLMAATTLFFTSMHYNMHHNPNELWRFAAYTGLCILLTLISQSQGMLIGTLFADYPTACMFLGPCSVIPLTLLGNFYVKLRSMDAYLVAISIVDYVRHAFESMTISLYGYDRCGLEVEHYFREVKQSLEKTILLLIKAIKFSTPPGVPVTVPFNEVLIAKQFSSSIVNQLLYPFVGADGAIQSGVMNEYNLRDDDMWPAVTHLIVHLTIFRIFCYIVLVRKLNEKM